MAQKAEKLVCHQFRLLVGEKVPTSLGFAPHLDEAPETRSAMERGNLAAVIWELRVNAAGVEMLPRGGLCGQSRYCRKELPIESVNQ